MRLSKVKNMALAAVLALGISGSAFAAKTIEQEVRHEILMLPYYSIFDQIAYTVDGNTVTLTGAVRRPTLKTDAERVVDKIEGVEHVNNQIEVLPLSPFDDNVRLAVARAVYGHPVLQRYAIGSGATIHIIVKNGNVTLLGLVASEMERNIAFMRANGVSGAFSVTNNLQIDRS